MKHDRDSDDLAEVLGDAAGRIAHAITPTNAAPGRDDHGGGVASLTEAVMSVGASLDAIARGQDHDHIAESLDGVARRLGSVAKGLHAIAAAIQAHAKTGGGT
jgi:hypothetical protein